MNILLRIRFLYQRGVDQTTANSGILNVYIRRGVKCFLVELKVLGGFSGRKQYGLGYI
jgi:hypothetical protein